VTSIEERPAKFCQTGHLVQPRFPEEFSMRIHAFRTVATEATVAKIG
jgi:hypothetical protein